MLEAIRERSKGWLAKLILTLITVPFALFGIDAYLRDAGSNASVAKVNGSAISVQEYGNAIQNLRNKLQSEGQKDLTILDNPEVKQSVLDRLITSRLLSAEAKNSHFKITNEQLGAYLIGLPEFQENGKFSQEQYDKILSQNQLSPTQFENRMRNDLLVDQVRQGLISLAYQPHAIEDSILKTENQQREVSVAEIKATDFVSEAKVTPEEIKSYYEKNKENFRVPEQVKLEFVMFSANNLIPKMQVSEDESKKYFQENSAKFQGDEQRRASHILISFGVGATEQAKADAKKKAEQILAEVKKSPQKFADFAKKYSQDPGSAEKGGDLGLFGHGAMVKPFEDAVFSMKPGEISDLVQSEFGYHIIKLTEISGESQSYDALKPKIAGELMYQKALSKFSEEAENFSNKVYEQSNSLKPAADEFGLQVQTTGWLSKEEGAKFFKNDKLINLVFTDEVLKDKRNTEAVEVSSNTLVSARVVDYKPSAPRTFDEVKGGIEDFLKLEQAIKLAQQKGSATLSDLKNGKDDPKLEWIPSVVVDRKNAQGLTDLAMSNVFKVDTSKLPAYEGVIDNKKGYLLIKVLNVTEGKLSDDTDKNASLIGLRSALASEYANAYIKSLRNKAKLTINQQLMLGESSTN